MGLLSYFGEKRVRKMGRSGQPFDLSPAEDVFHLLRTESKAESHRRAAAGGASTGWKSSVW